MNDRLTKIETGDLSLADELRYALQENPHAELTPEALDQTEHRAEVVSPWTGPATWTCSCGAGGQAPTMTQATRVLAAHKAETTEESHG